MSGRGYELRTTLPSSYLPAATKYFNTCTQPFMAGIVNPGGSCRLVAAANAACTRAHTHGGHIAMPTASRARLRATVGCAASPDAPCDPQLSRAHTTHTTCHKRAGELRSPPLLASECRDSRWTRGRGAGRGFTHRHTSCAASPAAPCDTPLPIPSLPRACASTRTSALSKSHAPARLCGTG